MQICIYIFFEKKTKKETNKQTKEKPKSTAPRKRRSSLSFSNTRLTVISNFKATFRYGVVLYRKLHYLFPVLRALQPYVGAIGHI
jgi:hypothetical protein